MSQLTKINIEIVTAKLKFIFISFMPILLG